MDEHLNHIFLKGIIFWLLISIFPYVSHSQSLPEQINFNSDSTRLVYGGVKSEGFYDESVVRNIYLNFYSSDFWEQMLENYDTDSSVLASLSYEDQKFDSVGVQFKGNTTFRNPLRDSSEKLSFSIKMDHEIDGQDIDGYNNFNFNNAYLDASFMKEVLYARISRDFLPALKGNFIRLYLNGEDWGLYANIQQLNGDFIEEWFPDNDGIRWRADAPVDTTLPQPPLPDTTEVDTLIVKWGDGTAALNFHGELDSIYMNYYTMKDSDIDDPWSYLVKVCDVLNNTAIELLKDSLSNYMNIDATLWYLAQELMFSDDDSYVFKGRMDYYLFVEKATGRMIPLEFDGNSAMNLRNVEWSPFMNEENVNYPLLNRLLAIPELRQRYIAHAKTLMENGFDMANGNAIIDEYVSLIGPHIQSDPKISFDYIRHRRGVNDLRKYLDLRRNYVLNNPEFAVISPEFGDVKQWVNGTSGAVPNENEEVIITASATHPLGINLIKLYYTEGFRGRYLTILMKDDGSEGDIHAGDGIFSGTIPEQPVGTLVKYYLETVANDPEGSAAYIPEGAEYDVFVYQTGVDYSTGTLVINEFLSSNDAVQSDEYGEYDDWIEIHNISDHAVEMEGYFLTDDSWDMKKWSFPALTLDQDGYIVVWADDDSEQGPLHSNFKLSADGEEILLTDPEGKILDYVSYGTQAKDSSYGRWPNGTGAFKVMVPTFSNPNIGYTVAVKQDEQDLQMSFYPNPTSGTITISPGTKSVYKIEIYNISGKNVYRSVGHIGHYSMDLSSLPGGLYFLKLKSGDSVSILKLVINH